MAYPKPDSINRNQKLEWTDLPLESGVDTPPLADHRKWQAQTLEWWGDLWGKPQASQWDSSGQTLWLLAELMDDLFAGRVEAHRVSGEIRQHEATHGLNPKAMLQLRWRVGEGESRPTVKRPKSKRDRKSAALAIVEGG